MKTRILKAVSFAFITCAAVVPWSAHGTAIVFTNFDGDANATFDFPNITVDHDTGPLGTGLADFTGSAFGISSTTDTQSLENKILSLVQADYAAFDVTFTTTQPVGTPGTDFKVWGIDDTAYTFQNVSPEDSRLFGKADGIPGGFARTWAGSFSLDGVTNPYGGTVVSSPELDITTHTIDEIAQALANNAAHEIAHLFGVVHEGLDAGMASQPSNLMQTDIESVMASTNKFFSSQANQQLLLAVGPAVNPMPEPSTIFLFMSALMGARFVRKPGRKCLS